MPDLAQLGGQLFILFFRVFFLFSLVFLNFACATLGRKPHIVNLMLYFLCRKPINEASTNMGPSINYLSMAEGGRGLSNAHGCSRWGGRFI